MRIRNDNTLGQNIMIYRTSLRMTKTELGKRLGVTAETITRYERDITTPSHDKLITLAAIFGTSINMLVRGFYDVAKELPEE